MTILGTLQVLVFFAMIVLVTKPLGIYMQKVFDGERTFLSSIFGPLERHWYRLLGVRPEDDMKWTTYAVAMLLFSAVSILFTYAALRLQGFAPAILNPQKFDGAQMPPHLAFNTANSFGTNTNWQSYSPEVTVNYWSNMVALAIHNWASAAVGMAIAIALVRGFARKSANGIGNFWADTVRATLYVLLPICVVAGVVMIGLGTPQNFAAPMAIKTVEGTAQTIAMGPVASQEVIKMLGTNGGGFFNANSAHPFENPSNASNLLQILLIFCIPAALTYTFGRMVGNVKQGWAVFGAMSVLFLAGAFACISAEQGGTDHLRAAHIQTGATATQPGGNMEGKEVRYGISASALFATVTTDASCGAVNSMHDSYTPLGGMVPIFNMMSGEVIFGGVGAGLYGMLMFAVIAVFIAGLMVGRTPEYLGKKIGKFEVQMAMLATLVLAGNLLLWTAISANSNYATTTDPAAKDRYVSVSVDPKKPADLAKLPAVANWNAWPATAYGNATDTYYGSTRNNLNNSGSHGFSEILYTYASATGNNGSAFAGITANTPHYNTTIGIALLVGRFLMIVPLLAIAGSMARKKTVPMSAGTFPTDGGTFVALLVGVVVIVNVLSYFPALSLGPIVEHFQMKEMKTQ
ncbi:potassium-transporting ATPase subunit KdpA [Fimbriimonas ginsengisoli]|uniref:Potassium-transporting ATPase potassium-binding subunit n=1 Tax=Fimbriimonas ginsengisoli Gsoil 348 TaxID=661478 RepID=A0A068NL36_FIMGI|nr:potassium-transporting ATPase subunit KdpA [Fimbriimonas ginsengisoli]AIE84122.1 potassium-transporting ATPase, A subunit [Fimbriimonas ginsengisoli Gsoil 348]